MLNLTQKINSLPTREALAVDLSMLENLPDDPDDDMRFAFADNGDLCDGTTFLLVDYTENQKRELINRGATVRRVVSAPYGEEEIEPAYREDFVIYPEELNGTRWDWTGIQSANLVWIAVDEPTEFDKTMYLVMTASEAASEFGLAEATVRQAINRGQIPARKSGGTWLILRADAEKRWGSAISKLHNGDLELPDDEPGVVYAAPDAPFPPVKGNPIEMPEGPAEVWGRLVIDAIHHSHPENVEIFVSREGFRNGEWIHVFEAGYFASEEEAEAWVADHS